MRLKRRGTPKGYSLVEILIAIAIFTIITASVTVFAVDSLRASQNARNRITASAYMEEISNAIEQNSQELWSSIVQNTGNGVKHIVFSSNMYTLTDGTTTKGNITLSLQIGAVNRDASNNIVQSGGTADAHTRSVDMTATWQDFLGVNKTLTSRVYINDWSSNKWSQTSQADFDAGTKTNVVSTNLSGGEVQLGGLAYPDWCQPDLTVRGFDLPGNGVGTSLTAIPGYAFVGTGNNSSGYTFATINISDTQPPVAATEGTFNGHKANGIIGDDTYTYIATDTNGKEVVILNTVTPPYTEVGYFDAPGTSNGNAIYVLNNIGYVTQGNLLRVFDLSSKNGARPLLGTFTLAATGTQIFVQGNYAYISIAGAAKEMQIVNISNPASMSESGYADVNGLGAVSVFVRPDGNRAYLATSTSATQKEFFIVNTTSKSGSLPVLGSYDTNGMNPRSVTAVVNDNRAMIAGINGEEYQVIDISNESAPAHCGGLNLNSGLLAVSSVQEADGDAYSYALSNDSSSEFKIIRGGPGAGPGSASYPTSGDFISQIFDTQSSAPSLTTFDWQSQIAADTTVQIQTRSGSTTTELTANEWVGPDGTQNTWFTSSTGNSFPNSVNGKRYIQLKAKLTSNGTATPVLQSFNINYQR